MRSRTLSHFVRAASVAVAMSPLVLLAIGCGEAETKKAEVGQLPPEAKQANKNMEDFMKNSPPAKKP